MICDIYIYIYIYIYWKMYKKSKKYINIWLLLCESKLKSYVLNVVKKNIKLLSSYKYYYFIN